MPSPPSFLPWKGADYLRGLDGCRLLVLGESAYSADTRDRYPNFTQDIVGRVVKGEHFPFFSRMSAVMDGALGTGRFTWNAVAFYNFVQEFVGEHPRDRPTPQMWGSGMEPFEWVLSDLRPQAVLVVGADTWNHGLSPHFPKSATSSATESGEFVRSWRFADIPPVVATWIDHPASFGFRSADWVERVSTLLAETKLAGRPEPE